MNKLLIIIKGGTVMSVYAASPAQVEVIDLDDLGDSQTSPLAITQTIQEASKGLESVY